MMRTNVPLLALGVGLLLVIVVAGTVGGPGFMPDLHTDMHFVRWRHDHVELTRAILAFTQLGGSAVLLPLAAAVGAWLWFRRSPRDALWFVAITMSGRILVELIKWIVGRPRPAFNPYPVTVSVNSFPSGHASNSTLMYLSIALFLAPPRWRRQALAAAMTLAVAIGCTRPILGVHWPTDILAGWCLGVLWVGFWWRVSRRGGTGASGYSPASGAALPE